MKKLTALLLALVLVVSTIPTVYAGGELSTDAKACVTLGMLKGPTGTVDVSYTQSEPSRLQVAIIFLRLKGLENAALSYSGTSNFKDANEISWDGGRAIMAYLKAHPELGWVGSNGYFSPNSLMSAQAYYKVLLESLGYTQIINGTSGDFAWNNTLQFAASKGLSKVAAVSKFTVNDMAVATIEALKARLKGSTVTLVGDLVEKGKLDRTAAAAAGLIAAPAVFAVDKVDVSNLVEVKVAFTTPVDKTSAENIKNYTIDKHEISSALVQPDGKTVILRLDIDETPATAVIFEPDEEFVLDMNGIYNLDKTQSVTNYESKTLIAADLGAPIAEKAELVGPYKVKVTFSEPIKDTENARALLNNGEYDTTVEDANGSRDVFVTLNDTLREGSYSLAISGAKDFMGYSSLKSTITLSYKKVTAAPTVNVVSSKEQEVVVQFNRPVMDESSNALDGDYFYHSNTSTHPEVTTQDNQTYTLDFSDNPLPEGSVKFVVLYNAGGSAITDEWGNEMKANATFTLNITADKTKPQITEVKVKDEQTLLMYFSEALNVDTALDINNYLVENEKGQSVDISDIDYNVTTANEYLVTVKFNEKLNGKYTIEVSGIKDMAAEPNVFATKTFSFEMKDVAGIDLKAVTATTVEGTGTRPDYIYITFPEDMTTDGQYGILNKENYLLSSNLGETFESLESTDTISLMTGSRSVKITLSDNSTYDVDNEDFRISIARVADKVGNRSSLFATTINPIPDAPLEAISFVVVDTKTIEVTFDGIIKTAPISGFRISKNGGTAASPSAVNLRYEDADNDGANETIAALTLKSTQQLTNSDAEGILEVSIVANAIKSETTLYCEEDLDNPVSDGIAPNIKEIIEDAGSIVINFDEDIAVTNAGLASTDLVIRDKNSKLLTAGVDYTVEVDSAAINIILRGNYSDYTGRITVDTKDNVTYIFDADGENAKLKPYGTPKALTID